MLSSSFTSNSCLSTFLTLYAQFFPLSLMMVWFFVIQIIQFLNVSKVLLWTLNVLMFSEKKPVKK